MAFPQVRGTNISQTVVNTVGHLVNMPAGRQVGDIQVVAFTSDGAPNSAFPNGWTTIVEHNHANSSVHMHLAWKAYESGDAGTITVSLDINEQTVSLSWALYDVAMPPYVSSVVEENDTTTPSPPSLSPAPGAQDYLYNAVNANDIARGITAYPSNMTTGPELKLEGTFTASTSCGTDFHEASSASFDPNDFSLIASADNLAVTLAYAPSTGVGPPGLGGGGFNTDLREFPKTNSLREFPR